MAIFKPTLIAAALTATFAPFLQAQQTTLPATKSQGDVQKIKAADTKPAEAQQTEPAADRQFIMPRIDVIGKSENLRNISGSADVIDKKTLEQSRVFNVTEALRKVPGINVRDEEGMGLRPNIGIRGLNPTRSTKTTLLEDGIPLAYAPYGDNASYYHPPIERFDRIEVLKGADQVRFGPQTIGGVINYITPTPPEKFGGSVTAIGGSRDYFNGQVQLGGKGFLFQYNNKQGNGARDNIHSTINDYNLKYVVGLTDHQALTLRANYYTEDSRITYSGLTNAEFTNQGARYNPFKNDKFNSSRVGVSATHDLQLNDKALLTTNLYFSSFDRDWWRQSSTTSDSQCGSAFTTARNNGAMVNPDACNSVQGRLRTYHTWGVEPRLKLEHNVFGVKSNLDAGFRAHFETQNRRQLNGASPDARSGTTAESNLRETQAYSWFMTNRFNLGQFGITPGVRYEYIDFQRTNRLTGVTGKDNLDAWLPSLGLTWNPSKTVTVFAGAHRGFAPPRTEDVIGSTGTSTDVGAEKSVNWEVGARAQPFTGTNLQTTFFRNDFQKQISVGSIAGGTIPLAQGKSLYQGVEFSGRVDLPAGPYLRTAYTWLPTAEQTTAFRGVVDNLIVSNSAPGNRMPYAPQHLVTAAVGFAKYGLDAQIEAVHLSKQFSDFGNCGNPATCAGLDANQRLNGQFAEIGAYTIFNLAINYDLQPNKTTLFFMVKNLTDDVYIVDRTRGILPGMPRLIQGGVKFTF